MAHTSIDHMMARPGIYVIQGPLHFFFVEVDKSFTCYQLRPTDYERDGVLSPNGWNIRSIHAIHGPFARVKQK